MKTTNKNSKQLVALENEIAALSTDQEGKLRGGFSAVSTAAMSSREKINDTCGSNGKCSDNGVCSNNGTCRNNGECHAAGSNNGNCGCTTTPKPTPVTPP